MKLPFNKTSLPLLLLLAFLVLGSFGCAAARHAQLKDQYILAQVENYAFTEDFARVWAEARALLFTHGYQVRDSGGGYVIETEWARVYDARRRYLVAGYVNSDGTTTVKFNFHEEEPGYATISGRDYSMEKELIRRVEPQSWATILNNAQIYADTNTQK